MTTPFPFPGHGVVNDNNGNPKSGLTVTFYAPAGQTTAVTDANGYFQADLQSIASDGDTIYVSGNTNNYFGSSSYVLDINDLSHDFSFDLDKEYTDLKIYYGSGLSSYVRVWCNDWRTHNKELSITTVLSKAQLDNIRDNVKPGAVKKLMEVLGEITYVDTTYSGGNTLKFTPVTIESSDLSTYRRESTAYVKSIAISPMEGQQEFIVKFNCFISGSTW